MALVRHKWNGFGRYVYYSTLLLYLVFLFCMTSFVVMTPPTYSAKRILSEGVNSDHYSVNRSVAHHSYRYSSKREIRVKLLLFNSKSISIGLLITNDGDLS